MLESQSSKFLGPKNEQNNTLPSTVGFHKFEYRNQRNEPTKHASTTLIWKIFLNVLRIIFLDGTGAIFLHDCLGDFENLSGFQTYGTPPYYNRSPIVVIQLP
jgi:hypothetical protein